MECPVCLFEVQENVQFCPMCQTDIQLQLNPKYIKWQKSKKTARKVVIAVRILLGLIVLAAAIVAGIYGGVWWAVIAVLIGVVFVFVNIFILLFIVHLKTVKDFEQIIQLCNLSAQQKILHFGEETKDKELGNDR